MLLVATSKKLVQQTLNLPVPALQRGSFAMGYNKGRAARRAEKPSEKQIALRWLVFFVGRFSKKGAAKNKSQQKNDEKQHQSSLLVFVRPNWFLVFWVESLQISPPRLDQLCKKRHPNLQPADFLLNKYSQRFFLNPSGLHLQA